MSDDNDSAPPTPAAPVNPHAEIERVASDAIGLPVRVVERVGHACHIEAPHDVTPHGVAAILAAMRKAHPHIDASVTLRPSPIVAALDEVLSAPTCDAKTDCGGHCCVLPPGHDGDHDTGDCPA